HEQRWSEVVRPDHPRRAPRHRALGASVAEVLPGQPGPAAPHPVPRGDRGVENDSPAAAADAVVELVVLVEDEALVEGTDALQGGATEAAEGDRLGLTATSRVAEARPADSEPRRGGQCHRGADGVL